MMMSISRLFLLIILSVSLFLFDHVDAGNIVDGSECLTWCRQLRCSNNCDISSCQCTDSLTPEQTAKKIGTIIGIVIGCIAGVALLTVGLCFAYHYRKFCFSHIAFAKVTTTHTIYNSADPSQNATITTERELRPGMLGYPYYGGGGAVTTVATVHSTREIIHETGPTDIPPADAPPGYNDGYTQPPGYTTIQPPSQSPGYTPIQPPSYAPTLITSHPTSSPQLPPQSHIPQLQPQTHILPQTHQPTLYNHPSYAQPSYAQPTYAQPQGYAQPSYAPQYGYAQPQPPQAQGYQPYMSNPAIQAPYQQSAPVEFEPVIKPGRKASGYVPVE